MAEEIEATTTAATKDESTPPPPTTTTTTASTTPATLETTSDDTTQQETTNETNKHKNFKNLTISVQQQQQQQQQQKQQQTIITQNSMKCQCPHYYNTEIATDPTLSTENIPSTVKSMSPDSCCTYGTHYPNRIFVGHLPGKANATDLADFFRAYGTVLEGKVVLDSFGRSRRFGFVTFATHDDVQNVLSQGSVFFKGKKINVGPAVKRMFGTEFSPPLSPAPDSSVSSSSDEEAGGETIVTVPPVNDPSKDPSTPATPKSGNVWLKINSKSKLTPKKIVENVPQQFVYPTTHQQQVITAYQQQQQQQHQQQQRQIHRQIQQHQHHQQHRSQQQHQQQQHPPQYYYFTTVPCNQAYAYQGGYYAQPPVYYGETGQPMIMNPHQWNMQQQSMYLPGSLSVA